MKRDYQKPQIEVKMLIDEPVMISTSVEIDSKQKNIELDDIGAKKNAFSDFSDFSSSSSSSSSSSESAGE